MVGILVVSHGKLAEALISSARFLVGNMKRIGKVSIWPKDNKRRIRKRIERGLSRVDEGDGVLVLTDIWGGAPAHLSLSFFERHRVEVVTGVNMPMLLTLSSYREGRSLEDISRLVKKAGRRSIVMAKGLIGWKSGTREPSDGTQSLDTPKGIL